MEAMSLIKELCRWLLSLAKAQRHSEETKQSNWGRLGLKEARSPEARPSEVRSCLLSGPCLYLLKRRPPTEEPCPHEQSVLRLQLSPLLTEEIPLTISQPSFHCKYKHITRDHQTFEIKQTLRKTKINQFKTYPERPVNSRTFLKGLKMYN